MIEINGTKPVEASLTIVLRGEDIWYFKTMIDHARFELEDDPNFIAQSLWEAIS